MSGAVDVTTGIDYTCAVMGNGEVMCWGNNDKGQLADGTTSNHNRPTLASLIMGISDLTAGQNTNCGLTDKGKVYCWNNGEGIEVTDLTTPSTFVMANRFGPGILALDDLGVPREWKLTLPSLSGNLDGATFGDSGLENACVLKKDGTVACWGGNNNGELGNNSTVGSSNPALVSGLNGAYALAVGQHHSCVLMESGDIQCWGLNGDGQLGDATNTTSLIPVTVK